MGKKIRVDGMEIELDDDISPEDLDKHPDPENALSDEEIAQIEADHDQLGE